MKICKNKAFFIAFLVILMSNEVQNMEIVQKDNFFIQNIWQQIRLTGIMQKIFETKFIQGIKSGQLNPWCFSKYIVQDLQYMYRSAQLSNVACKDGQKDAQFLQFCNTFRENQNNYYLWMKEQLFISTAESISAVHQYTKDKVKTYEQNSYHYIAVVNYACFKVYHTLGIKLLPEANQQSPYFDWITENAQYEDYKMFQATINYYQRYFDRQQVKMDVLRFVNYEFQLFRDSCSMQSQRKSLKFKV